MDVRYLNYILTIAKTRNMTKAAEVLYVSQSTLSQYLSKLEQELGSQLFIRAKGELVPTPAGEMYIEAAQKVVKIQKELYRSIHSLDQKGHITIGITSQIGLDMLTGIIPTYKGLFPGVAIEISEFDLPDLKKMFEADGIDCAIASLNDPHDFSSEHVDVIRREEVLLAVPSNHPCCGQNSSGTIPISDLSKCFAHDNWLLSRNHSTLRHLTDGIFSKQDFSPSTVCETNSIQATRSMVAMAIGIALIAESCALDRELITYYSLKPKLYRYNVFIRRKNWIINRPEQELIDRILNYWN
ncbi:MAG: LysR substrate-binding domain-containing protein [Oscillospiraceae bacterium]